MRMSLQNDMALSRWAVLVSLVTTVVGQHAGWEPDQVNATMCKWNLPRVGVIRDTAYIDGGYLYWQAGMSDGSYGGPQPDDEKLGLIYKLNFTVPFKFTDNITSILQTQSTAPGSGAVNNYHVLYVDGTLFANDGEFIEYGGLSRDTDTFDVSMDEVLVYKESWYSSDKSNFEQGFEKQKLGNVTRFVTSGGAVSVPSENRGFYFSGMRANNSGPVYQVNGLDTDATTLATSFITVDMSNQLERKFTNDTLPSDIPPRAGSELAFVPAGKNGILVAIGGVTDPEWESLGGLDPVQTARSARLSPEFISTVSIYDIASKKWYRQKTASPPAMAFAKGCTVVASANDSSSHNIYWYGGTEGLASSQPFSDSVWVLSVPSFTWTQVNQGDAEKHGRAGHRCVKPYPDQMLVIGGDTPAVGTGLTCLPGNDGARGSGMVQGFNLSSCEWMTEYSPEKWSPYTVPLGIARVIGGDGQGGATKTSPESWDNEELATVFGQKYEKEIKTYYPYPVAAVGPNNTRPSVTPNDPGSDKGGGGGTPKWLAPVLGVVLGLIFITALVVAILLWRRRKYLRNNHSVTDGTSEANRGRILSWVKGSGDHNGPKSPDMASTTEVNSQFNTDSTTDITGRPRAFSSTSGGMSTERSMSPLGRDQEPVEAGSEMVHELADTSQIQELSATGTGMAYLPGTPRSPGGLNRMGSTSTDGGFLSPSTDGTGTWNSGSGGTGTYSTNDAFSPIVSPSTPRPDSPTEGAGMFGRPVPMASAGQRPVVMKGRGSETSIVSPVQPGEGTMNTMTSISPPTPNREGSDYMSARSVTPTGKTRRKSAFGEHFDEKS